MSLQLNDIQRNKKNFVERTAYHYSISPFVVLIRLKKLGLIEEKRFNELYRAYEGEMNEGLARKSDQGGPDFYKVKQSKLDNRFLKTVGARAKEGKILYTEAYELVGAKGNTYHELMNKLEGSNDKLFN